MTTSRSNLAGGDQPVTPSRDELDALTDAARRDVNVTLILPDKSHSGLSLAMRHAVYGKLLRAGVQIYEMHGVVLHSKIVTVDGVWSVVGSSNLDHRSIVFNDEVDAIVVGSATADELTAMAAEDRAAASPITMADWSHRPVTERVRETFAKLWTNLL